jgi:NitT/TauT family transport system substrate-binding protein
MLPQFAFTKILVVLAMSVLFLGCERRQPLRVGLNVWPGYEFLYLAQELGYYEEEGVDVQLVDFSSLGDARRSFERGQIDGLGTTVVEVILAGENAADPLKIVNVVDYSNGADVIIAKPGLSNLKALKGGKVGVELGSICVFVLARALESADLAMADIVPVSKDQASMAADLHSGLLDAVVTYPPTSIELLRNRSGEVIFSTAQIPREVVDVLAFGDATIKSRPEDIAAILRAFHRAQDYLTRYPAEALRIMSAREGLSQEEFNAALNDGMTMVSVSGQARYLKEGDIRPIVARTLHVLRQNRLITHPQSEETYYTDLFATEAR